MLRHYFFFLCITLSYCSIASSTDSLAVKRRLFVFDSLLPLNPLAAEPELKAANRLRDRALPATLKTRLWISNSKWYMQLTKCDSALYYARRAWQQCNEPVCRLLSARFMGGAFRCSGLPDSALVYYFKAEYLARLVQDTPALARSYYNIGNLLSELSRFEKATGYYQLANKLAISKGDEELIARTYQALASNLADRGNTRMALPPLTRALNYYRKMSYHSEIAMVCNNLAGIYEQLAEYPQALLYYKESLQINKQLSNQKLIGREYNNIATVLIHLDHYKDAIPMLLEAEKNLEQSEERTTLPDIYHNLALCYAHTGNYEKAYAYKNVQQDLSDSLRSIDMMKHTERLQEEFEAEKRQLEITNLKQENEVKDLKNKVHLKQRSMLIGLTIALVCIALFVFFILLQRVRNAQQVNEKNGQIHRQQMNEVLRKSELQSIHTMLETQEKERRRIAEDLHDRVGSMLSVVKLQFSRFGPKENEDAAPFKKVTGLLDDACEEIRQVAHNLVSGVLSAFGLLPALNDMANALRENSPLTIDIKTYGLNERMSADMEINLYRIFQELFNNTIRHASASAVEIDMSVFDNQLTCIYNDNGKGFEISGPQRKGIGLRNIYSRVDKLGGTLHIDSGKDNGSTFVLTFTLT